MVGYRAFDAVEIAMIEHNIIKESELLEWKSAGAIWYLSGIHEFAERLIQLINERGGE